MLKLIDNPDVISLLFFILYVPTSLWIYTASLLFPTINYLSPLVLVLVGSSFQGTGILLN